MYGEMRILGGCNSIRALGRIPLTFTFETASPVPCRSPLISLFSLDLSHKRSCLSTQGCSFHRSRAIKAPPAASTLLPHRKESKEKDRQHEWQATVPDCLVEESLAGCPIVCMMTNTQILDRI